MSPCGCAAPAAVTLAPPVVAKLEVMTPVSRSSSAAHDAMDLDGRGLVEATGCAEAEAEMEMEARDSWPRLYLTGFSYSQRFGPVGSGVAERDAD